MDVVHYIYIKDIQQDHSHSYLTYYIKYHCKTLLN